MKVLLIGGAGFIGASVADSLKKHGLVVEIADTSSRLKRSSDFLRSFKVKPFEYPDTTDAEKVICDSEVIVHLAYTTEPSSSMQSLLYDAQTNIIPSLKIFQAAKNLGVKKIVFSSSGGTIYGNPNSLPVNENAKTKPLSAYGISKLAIEQYLALYKDLKGISLRVGNAFGPLQFRGASVGVIARYLSLIHTNQPLEVWGDGSVTRDYIYITDVSSAYACAVMNDELPPGQYNIGSGIGYSVNEIIDIIFKITGKRVPVNYKSIRPYDVPSIILDTKKFQRLTSWSTEKHDMQKSITDMWLALNTQRL